MVTSNDRQRWRSHRSLQVNGDGKLVVPNNTTPGTYTVTYKICDKANPGVCDTAVVKIKVTGTTSTIDAVDDGEKTLPRTGGIVEVLTNDTLNGSPATKDNVTVRSTTMAVSPVLQNGDGKLEYQTILPQALYCNV